MKSKVSIFFLIALISVGCSSSNTEPSPDQLQDSIAQYPSGTVGKDIFYSTMWRFASGSPNLFTGGIYSLNYDGSAKAFLYKDALLYSAPRDTQLVFSIGRSIYLGNTKGSSYRKLFTTSGDVVYAILSPDAQKMLYAVRGFSTDTLAVYDIASGTSVLLEQPAFHVLSGDYPVFSDDSKKILYVLENNSENTTNLLLINADGTNKQVLATDADYMFFNQMGDFFYQSMDFSPDGKQCCYVRIKKTGSALTVHDIATGMSEDIDSSLPTGAMWSPLGNYLTYNHGDYNNEDSLVIYDVHTKQKQIVGVSGTYPNGNLGAYDWSSDETTLITQLSYDSFHEPLSSLSLMNRTTGRFDKIYNIENMIICFRGRRIGEH